MCLGNISTDFSATNAQKTGLHGNIYDFIVEYGVLSDYEVHDIHAYVRKKMVWYKMFRLIKKILVVTLLSSVNSLKPVLTKNQKCKTREVMST